MGAGGYSVQDRDIRAQLKGYDTKSSYEIFTQRSVHEAMDPRGVQIRESRDSEEHPNSIAIIIALDQTGSMRRMPHYFIKEGLPNMIGKLMELGIKDPQVMFCAIGDAHNGEEAPLQISQFESSDELMDYWLERVFLEGKGGGNDGEDYSLIHDFAANHTSIDCFLKRNQKGFLFTIGDDKPHRNIPDYLFKHYLGGSEHSNKTAKQMIEDAKKTYNVFHVHVGYEEASSYVKETWKDLLGENFIDCPEFENAPEIIANKIADNFKYISSEIISKNSITPDFKNSFNEVL